MGKDTEAKKRAAEAMEAYRRQEQLANRAEAAGRRLLARFGWMAFGIALYQLAESYGWLGIEC